MKTKILIFGLLLLFGHLSPLQAQPKKPLSMANVDAQTYQLYLKGDWKNLVKKGEAALKNGIDFYFLKVRMGIAYYHLKKYRKAAKFLEKAYAADTKNQLVAEYLYYAYLFGGRAMDAYRIADAFNIKLKQKIGFDQSNLFDAIGLDYKVELIDDYASTDETGDLEQNVITENTYFGADFQNYYGAGNLFYLHLGKLNRNYTIYTSDSGTPEILPDQLTQYQIYLSNYSQIAKGFNLSFAINWLLISTENEHLIRIGRGGMGGRTETVVTTSLNSEFVGFAGLRKDIGNFKFGVTSSVSNMNDNWQIIPGFETIWYPLSNTNLYLTLNPLYKFEYDENDTWQDDFIFKSTIGFKIGPVYIEPAYTYGDLYNFVDADGLIAYNDEEVISNRYELSLYSYLVKGRLKLFLKGQQYDKTNFYQLNNINKAKTFTNQSIITGILWKF